MFYNFGIYLAGILLVSAGVSGLEEVARRTIDVLGLVPDSGDIWPAGEAIRIASNMALEQVNSRSDVLHGYNLSIYWKDTQCDSGKGLTSLFEHLYEDPPKSIVFGPGCSTVCPATSEVTQLWNLTMLSYSCQQQSLSNRARFPNFFRTVVSGQVRNPSLGTFFRNFGWQRIAIIQQSYESFTDQAAELSNFLETENITVLTSEIFQNDASLQLRHLQEQNAKIIVALMYEDKARKTFCQVYDIGLYGRKIVWIFPNWYPKDWYKTSTHCPISHLEEVLEGVLYIGPSFTNPLSQTGIGGLDADQFQDEFRARTPTGEKLYGSEFAPSAYDGVWAVALALNHTINILDNDGHGDSIDSFTYADSRINGIIQSSFYEIEFMGVRGLTSFDNQGNPSSIITIDQKQGNILETVGLIFPTSKNNPKRHVEWYNGGIKWRGDSAPRDGIITKHQEEFVSVELYIVMCLLAGMGIINAIVLLFFNISLRQKRIIKMSSPNLNNVILVGCILAYLTITLQEQTCDQLKIFYLVRIYLFAMSFAMIFGALFAKTWRVHRIMVTSSKTRLRVVIKDSYLLLMVMVLVIINCTVLTTWQFADPIYVAITDTSSKVSPIDDDIIIQYERCNCRSTNQIYFLAVLYGIQGLLLVFGVFLAWETKKVKLEALNDSRQIGICIYNVILLTILGLTVTYLTSNHVDISYGFTSVCLIAATTSTQYIIFVPKLQHAWKTKDQVGSTSVHTISVISASADSVFNGPTDEIK